MLKILGKPEFTAVQESGISRGAGIAVTRTVEAAGRIEPPGSPEEFQRLATSGETLRPIRLLVPNGRCDLTGLKAMDPVG